MAMTTIFASDRFSYNTTSKTLVTCASDLGLKPGEFPKALRIRNRDVATFEMTKVERTAEGDLYCIRYRQVDGPCVALILND
jgi:hypothetical protein